MKEEIFADMKKRMAKSLETLGHELAGLRTGRASVALLDSIKVDFYGTLTPLKQIATLSVPDIRTITIQPWDTSQLHAIEKAIMVAKRFAEECKVSIRNIRRDANESLKKLEKEKKISQDELKKGTQEVQDFTDKETLKVDGALAQKEADIMEV